MVLGPVAAQLKGKRLLIVSDGALQYIPFAALPSPDEGGPGENARPTPLVVEHEIVHLPSASVLAVLRLERVGRKEAPKFVAVLADPVFDRQDARIKPGGGAAGKHADQRTRGPEQDDQPPLPNPFSSDSLSEALLTRSANDVGLLEAGAVYLPRLQYSRQEAESILATTPAGQGLKAVDFQASRTTATSPELAQYRVVHFATHGLIDSAHPELSGLVFSLVDERGRPQNGFLELQDIYNLNLPADLVVLSACETGLGKEVNGEGLIGLTRGFMYAGASRVVASLWKIDDVATADLMARFYRAMERDSKSPVAALRQAQIEMWQQKRWNSPYYWAAFQIQGEWRWESNSVH